MFGSNELRQLSGLSLERQVITILVKNAAPLAERDLQLRLEPTPTAPAFTTLLAAMRKANAIVDIPDKGVGLPGWLLHPPKPELRSVPVRQLHDDEELESPPDHPEVPATPTPSLEKTTMPKTKRGPRVSAEKAAQDVAAVLTEGGAPITDIVSDSGLALGVVKRALLRLKAAGHAALNGRGKTATWSKGAKSGSTPAAAPTPTPRRTPAKGNGDATRKFGYHSDGSISIDCELCKGTLDAAEFKAFRTFYQRFEDPAK